MEPLVFYTLVVAALAVVVRGFVASGPGYLHYPVLFSIVILVWVVPQLAAIRLAYSGLDDSLVTLYLMTLLCLGGTILGWGWGISSARSGMGRTALDPIPVPVLFGTAAVLTAVAGAMTVLIRDTGEGVGGMQSGTVTIFLFFQNIKILSLFLAGYLAMRHRSCASLVLLALNLLFYAPLILLYFRRRAMVEVGACAILCLWFARRTIVPRSLVIAALPVAFVMMFAVGALRTLAQGDEGWSYLSTSDVLSIDFLSLTPLQSAKTSPELLNATYIVRLAEQTDTYTLGAGTWNRLVFQWVPAQIVGVDLKSSLMIGDNVTSLLSTSFFYSVGAFLRRTRLDEVPQLVNILLGHMSLVGPRPDLYEHAVCYVALIPGYRERHTVRPGITGLAQTRLGYAEGIEATARKVEADLEYIREMSFRLEARIVRRTVGVVLTGFGAR